jgi:hypothetical protein
MNYGKTIKIFLPSGKTDEVKIASIANSTVQATLISRNILNEIEKYEEISSTGIYFLLDSEENVYVGESENVKDRIKQHNKDERKDWWNTLITINVNSLNSPLTKAHVKYLEGLSYEKIKEAGRFVLEQTIPAAVKLSRNDIADMMHIFEDIKILVSTLGFLLFEPKRKIITHNNKDEKTNPEKEIFYMNNNNTDAFGEYNTEGFLVYKDSKILKTPTADYKNRKYKGREDETTIKRFEKKFQERENLLLNNKIKDDGDFYILLEDIMFDTPSGAASFVGFNIYNGWDKWKTKEGKTLEEIHRQNKENNS